MDAGERDRRYVLAALTLCYVFNYLDRYLLTTSHSLSSDYFPPERRPQALAVFQLGVYIGQFLGLAVGGLLVAPLGWRWTFVAVGAPGLVLALLLRLTVREPARGALDRAARPAAAAGIGEVARKLAGLASFRWLALGAGLASFAGTGFGFWVPTLFVRIHGWSPLEVGGSFGWISPGSAVLGSLLAGALALAVPAGILGGGWAPPVYAAVQKLVPPHMRAIAASILILFITLLGMGAGPWVVGWLSDLLAPGFGAEGLRYALAAVLGTSAFGAAALALGARSRRADLAAAHPGASR